MNCERNGLDERQRAHRDRIGNQCFLLLLYGILIDAGLNGFGVKWLPYPANMMALLTVCAGIYQVRIILGNSYLPPGAKAAHTRRNIIIMAVFSVAVAAVASVIFIRNSTPLPADTGNSDDNSAMILFIISGVSLLIALLTGIVQRRRNKENEKE
jgi:LPXTG-motif cell wall-anchored protein